MEIWVGVQVTVATVAGKWHGWNWKSEGLDGNEDENEKNDEIDCKRLMDSLDYASMSMSQVKYKVELPLKSSETEVSKTEVQSQPSTDRVIELTFQRKRKREATNDESGSSEMSQENQSAPLSHVKVNMIGESTPEKKRLEQVAHQLMPNVVYHENWTVIGRDHIELSDDRNKFLRERVHVLQSISGGRGCSSAQQHKGGDPI